MCVCVRHVAQQALEACGTGPATGWDLIVMNSCDAWLGMFTAIAQMRCMSERGSGVCSQWRHPILFWWSRITMVKVVHGGAPCCRNLPNVMGNVKLCCSPSGLVFREVKRLFGSPPIFLWENVPLPETFAGLLWGYC